jgi:hypothetical protein
MLREFTSIHKEDGEFGQRIKLKTGRKCICTVSTMFQKA